MLDKIDLGLSKSRKMRVLMLAALAFFGGCASSVVVKPDIPNPLVQKLPLKAGLVYTDTFKDYVYLENEKKRGSLKSLDFTYAQTTMFEQVFGALTNLVEEDDPTRNLTIEPQILDFQYSAPSETKLKQYEIWIKYRLKLRDANDASIADWTIKGYGKTPTGLLTSASSAFNAATNVALRDVGAQLSTRFSRQRVVKTLLDGGTPPAIAEDEPEIAEPEVAESKSESGAEPEAKPEADETVELASNDVSDAVDSDALGEQPSFEEEGVNNEPDATLEGDDQREEGVSSDEG